MERAEMLNFKNFIPVYEEALEEVLTIQQRMKKKQVMRRSKAKIAQKRKQKLKQKKQFLALKSEQECPWGPW